MDKQQFIREALTLPTSAIAYHVSEYLARQFPDKVLVEGGDGLFNVEEYARAGQCMLEHRAIVHNQVITHWHGREMNTPGWLQFAGSIGGLQAGQSEPEEEISDRSYNAWFSVAWRDQGFEVVIMNWSDGIGRSFYHYWLLVEIRQFAREFITEVCRWNAELRGEVLVFAGGCWHKDARLFRSIQGTTFDNLILKGNLKQEIREDLEQFFAARDLYEAHGIPWKRGILFVGSPGNGKTHTVKAIINSLQQRCLYVRSFHSEYQTDEDNIHAVFERARKSAPCMLVLEDLDSLLTPQNRSFFLNELDGFAANVGIVTLATTNHPERLDPAILDRPSRFDRKYPFNLPETPERQAYIAMWNASLKPALRLSEGGIGQLAEATDGFSFAYLKELFLSSMMRWIANPGQQSMEQAMLSLVNTLREQMISQASEPVPEDLSQSVPAFARRFAPRVITR
ncbi:MAG: ATP-binding protein [Ktedonobacteraceae bacterium]|nr:ATP-binding protein [Ktedonobacteraceae bacterium]